MILARGIRGEQWPASFESPSYTGNNLPDSLSMNEWPSAARPRKARHLNNKGPGGHPLLYYCKFIAAFFVWLPLQADAVSVLLIERPASKGNSSGRGQGLRRGIWRKYDEYSFCVQQLRVHLKSTASYFCATDLMLSHSLRICPPESS